MNHPPKNVNIMCFDWERLILKHTDLPAHAKYLALYLGTYMNKNQDMAWPGLKTIERETGLSHPTVLKYLDVLVSEGWIVKQSGSSEQSNRYWINVPEEVGSQLTYGVGSQLTYGRYTGYLGVGSQLTSNNNINNNLITSNEFAPPSVAEVEARIKQMGYLHVTAERFVNFYGSKSWMVGKHQMVDWQKALAGWESREKAKLSSKRNSVEEVSYL